MGVMAATLPCPRVVPVLTSVGGAGEKQGRGELGEKRGALRRREEEVGRHGF